MAAAHKRHVAEYVPGPAGEPDFPSTSPDLKVAKVLKNGGSFWRPGMVDGWVKTTPRRLTQQTVREIGMPGIEAGRTAGDLFAGLTRIAIRLHLRQHA